MLDKLLWRTILKGLWQNGKGKSDMKKCKLLLFDLDGTLLQSDKTISKRREGVIDGYSI